MNSPRHEHTPDRLRAQLDAAQIEIGRLRGHIEMLVSYIDNDAPVAAREARERLLEEFPRWEGGGDD